MAFGALIGLVGDYDSSVPAHLAIPPSLELAGDALGAAICFEWIPTPEILGIRRLKAYDGIWCVPATPYKNMDGALLAIRWARENGTPFLGTCGGFQHAIVEYARNVLGWSDADHAESNPETARAVIAPLSCALVETTETVRLFPDSRLAAIYGKREISEGYRCRYGLNQEFREALLAGPLRGCADDHAGEIRAIELTAHPFFIGALFQPERAALRGEPSPLITAFSRACVQMRSNNSSADPSP